MTTEPHGPVDATSGIGFTAFGVTAARAVQTSGDDPLVVDPYAAAFVNAAVLPMPMPTSAHDVPPEDGLWQRASLLVGLRSKYFDDYLRRSIDAGVRQVVLLAAGFDSRAYRLDWPPGTTVYELDLPDVLEFKHRVLAASGAQPRCVRRAVAVDLQDPWAAALTEAGFDREQPTAWVGEGLLMYLSAAVGSALVETVHSLSAPGSTVGLEQFGIPEATLQDSGADEPVTELLNERSTLLPSAPYGDPAEQLSTAGWTVEVRKGPELAERYNRSLSGELASTYRRDEYYLTGRLGGVRPSER